jgi:arginine/lysine/ornithine decarboxylase
MITVHVLLVSPDSAFVAGWRQTLSDAASNDPATGEMDYVFTAESDPALALALCRSDGYLQAVVIDLLEEASGAALAAEIAALRPELDLFLALPRGCQAPATAAELVDREESRPELLLRQLQKAIGQRAKTPFADTLRDYVYSGRDAWHTPGHSGGDSLRDSPWVADFYSMMGEHIFNTDLSVSVQVLDSLLEPHSVIQEAQDLAARAFGARRTFFVTNGTSTANKVIVQHLLGDGGKMILDQACHKSLHHAVVLFGVDPVYLRASVKPEYGFYGPVCKRDIYQAIDDNPDAKLLVLTSCTYDGFYYDLEPIISYAHDRGIKVLIDEAWYAHGRFHPSLRPNALECGADYVTQSTHKMLSAFSQASMIHVADPDFDESRFREHLNMHTSTSPQYAMIASLDVARKQMSMEGYKQLSRCIDIAARLKEKVAASQLFRVLELEDMLPGPLLDDGIRLDPTKVSIDVSAAGVSARHIQLILFERFGIQLEKVTDNTLTVLITLGTTEGKLLRLGRALQDIAVELRGQTLHRPPPLAPLPQISPITTVPRQAYFGPGELLPLRTASGAINSELLGRVSAEQLVPYPPGIPLLVPGQSISREILDYLQQLESSDNGIEIHGLQSIAERPALRLAVTSA